tara:strand:+ start:1422 stop:2618 length:1197 start_codon:yes stop_codon:yes gene_type:complete
MDAHTAVAETPAQETPEIAPENAVENIPTMEQPEEAPSFTDALEAALSELSNPTPEPTPEPAVEEAPEPAVEEAPESVEEVAEEPKSIDPIEDLNDDIGDNWTPKAANRFKQLKDELKNNQSESEKLRQLVADQEQKIKEMSGLIENRDIDQLQDRIAIYEHEKVINDLESTDAYNEAVTQPLQEVVTQASEIADKYEIDPDALIDALSLDEADAQDQALMELLPNATDRDKARIYNIIDKIDPILDRRNHLMENAEEALEEAKAIEEQQYNQELAEEARIRSVVTKNVAERVSEKLPFLSGVDGFDMNEVKESVSEINPETLHPVDFAYNAVAAKLLPVIVEQYIKTRREAESLTDQLATYEEAEPTMSGSPKSDSTSPRSSGLSFAESIEAALSGS